jgi:hypothetical protein
MFWIIRDSGRAIKDKCLNGERFNGQKTIKSMYFQLFSGLVDWKEKHIIVDQKPGEKD